MKTFLIASLTVVLSVLITACGAATPTEAPVSDPVVSDPVSVVKSYYEAINANQIDKALTFTTDNITIIDPLAPAGCRGKDQANEHWNDLVRRGYTFELSDLKETGERVTYSYVIYQNGTSVQEGSDGVVIIEDGKIAFNGVESTVPR